MARKKNNVPVNSLAEAIQLIRQGKQAPPWALRELLDLSPGHSMRDAIRALHNAIHAWQKDAEPELDGIEVRVVACSQLVYHWFVERGVEWGR